MSKKMTVVNLADIETFRIKMPDDSVVEVPFDYLVQLSSYLDGFDRGTKIIRDSLEHLHNALIPFRSEQSAVTVEVVIPERE